MSYPTLPLAFVSALASLSPERNSLHEGPKHVSALAQHNLAFRTIKFAVTEDYHWNEVEQVSVRMCAEDDADTFTMIYPDNFNKNVDLCVLMEGGKPPMLLEWTHGPAFGLRLIDNPPEDQKPDFLNAGVIITIQAMLDKDVRKNMMANMAATTPRSISSVDGIINDSYKD